MYGQAMAILALARYGRAFNDSAAVGWALRLFQSVDAARHDPSLGGYLEGVEVGYPAGVGLGLRPGVARSQNTHLHLLEALIELGTALGTVPEGPAAQPGQGADGTAATAPVSSANGSSGNGSEWAAGAAVVEARLGELVRLVQTTLWQPGSGGHMGVDFREDWTVLDPSARLYGHEMEFSYFLLAAARQLGRAGAEAAADAAFAVQVGRAGQGGYDPQRGGFWTDGDASGPVMRDWCGQNETYKTWWAQFEGASGLFWLWRQTGEADHWARLLRMLRVIADSFHDPAGGEFFYYVTDGSGAPVCKGGTKADSWKAAYHTLRGLLYLREWLAAVRGGAAPVPQV